MCNVVKIFGQINRPYLCNDGMDTINGHVNNIRPGPLYFAVQIDFHLENSGLEPKGCEPPPTIKSALR